jgi:pyrimidine operon attenuation protein/uracil phosphoribosyltransferase
MSITVIQEANEIERTIRRLAHEVIENNQGASELILVGILTRGATLAERIAIEIGNFENVQIPTGALDIVLHRDDLKTSGPAPKLQKSTIPKSLDGMTVVLVDDVLYTGRTCRAALDALMNYGRPASVRLAVYIDRGHRELPIRPDFIGRNIPTAPNQSILVELNEVDGVDRVSVIEEEL